MELQRREATGMSREEVAGQLEWSTSTIALDTNAGTVFVKGLPTDHPDHVIGHVSWRVISGGRIRTTHETSLRLMSLALSCRLRFYGWEELLVAANWWHPQFRYGDGEPGMATQHAPRDAVTNYATIRLRALRLLEYLEAVRDLREQPNRYAAMDQDRRWWADDIPVHPSCVLTATGDEFCPTVSKAQLPRPVPEDVTTHLRTGVTDSERESAFTVDIDKCLPTLERRPGSGSSYMGMWRVSGGHRHHTRGRRCGRRNSMKIYTTFACGLSVSPHTSCWCGVTAFELDRGLKTCLHLQHLTQKY